jgi:membrane protease YdiL (CAAX protease family)
VPFATLGAGAIAVLLVSAVVAAIVFAVTGSAAGDTPSGLVIVLTVIQDAVLVGAAVYATYLVLKRVTPAMFGLRPVRVLDAVQAIVVVYGAYWLFSILVLAIFGEPPEQQIVQDLKSTESLPVVIGFGVLTCAVAPIAEEFFFRGFMFNALAGRLGVVRASGITGVVFGLVHFTGSSWIGVLVLGFFGIGLCVLFARTGSLLPCLALHALNNAISFGFTKSLPAWGIAALILAAVGTATGAGVLAAAPRRIGAWPPARP